MPERVTVTEDDGEVHVIGQVVERYGKRVFFSRRKSSVHFYRRLNGWGVDKAVLENQLLDSVDFIAILDEDTDMLYITSPKTMMEKGTVIHHYPHRPQVVLPIGFWRTKQREGAGHRP